MTPSQQYRDTIRQLSDRIVTAQKPIRILEVIKRDGSVKQAFFADGCRDGKVAFVRGKKKAPVGA